MVCVDESGRSCVTDSFSGAGAIAVFSAAGRYLYRIGGPGREGPGEFRSPRIASIGNGVLQVWDSSQNRLTRFETGGTLVDLLTLTDEGRANTLSWAARVGPETIVAFRNHTVFRDDRQ